MPAPDEIALAYQRQQKSVILAVIAAVLSLWKRLDRDNLTRSWAAGVGPSLVETVTQAQLAAAAAAPAYLERLAAAQGMSADMSGLVPSALSGVASDGRPLESLMYQPIILFKRLLAAGKQPEEAMRQATNFMALIASTQVADAGRGAVSVGIASTREWVTYVRVVHLPACSRCIILAGREYSWSTGFQRHENCDCSMMPRRVGDDPPVTPEQLFAQMSTKDQDRRFGKAGAQALRLGADMGQVVNARRGMRTATGGRLITTEGTTVRGVAGKQLGNLRKVAGERYRRSQTVRPMPEQLIADANGDRELAVEFLQRFGYLNAASRRRAGAASNRTVPSTAP